MAIDKESSGLPEVDLHRKTTKVNLAMIVAVGLFFVVTFALVIYFANRSETPEENYPQPPLQDASG